MFNGHPQRLPFGQHLFLPDKVRKFLWPHPIGQRRMTNGRALRLRKEIGLHV
jgi:hypothetical protein